MTLRYLPALIPTALMGMTIAVQAQPSGDGSDFWHYGWGWGHMIFGSVMMIVFWGGLILLVVLAVRWFSRDRSGGTGAPSRNRALDILQERFARGEIEKEDFEQRKRLLSD